MEETLIFYALQDIKKRIKINHCRDFIHNNHGIELPCVLLLRDNGWNDYGYFSSFESFYVSKEREAHYIGEIKIIEYKAKNGVTKLPETFNSLDKNTFFSRGVQPFYKRLKELGNVREMLLDALNDIHFMDYSETQIFEIGDGSLELPLKKSLYRYDGYELSISADYYNNAVRMLKNIEECSSSISDFDEEKTKFLIKLLYGSVITTVETYLGDAFKSNVINNQNYFISFLRNYNFPDDQKKYTLKKIGLKGNNIKEYIKLEVKQELDKLIFHKLDVVDNIYEKILKVKLPITLWKFRVPVLKRHDIFHRNGRNKEGELLDIGIKDLLALIRLARKFILETENVLDGKLCGTENQGEDIIAE